MTVNVTSQQGSYCMGESTGEPSLSITRSHGAAGRVFEDQQGFLLEKMF